MALKTNIYYLVCLSLCLFHINKALAGNINQQSADINSQLSSIKPQSIKNQQDLFLQAEKALKKQDDKRFKRLYNQLIHYPLVDYLERDRLLQLLAKQKPSVDLIAQIQSFLAQHNNQVVSRKLRYQWLNYLADTNQKSQFLSNYQPSASIKLKCRSLQFRLQNKETIADLQPAIETIWLTGHSLPKACDSLIKLWKSSGSLNNQLIWERMLNAAKEKQYRLVTYLNRLLPKEQQANGQLLVKVLRRPLTLTSMRFKAEISSKGQTVIVKGLSKLAWQYPEKAIKLWKRLDGKLDLKDQQIETLKRSIALSLAIEGAPKAKQWLKSLKRDLDPSVDQWLLSTALTSEDWNLIEHVTRNKNNSSIELDKWRYWRAISIKHKGFPEVSAKLMKSLSEKRSYYGFLAAIAQDQPPQLNNALSKTSQQKLKQLADIPEAQKSFQFFQLGRLAQARSEWNRLLEKTSAADLVPLALLAYQWGWNHQSILAFAKSQEIDDLAKRFPLFQIDRYQQESHKQRIPISWAYAITRQESAFKVDASSGANAHGLMQLTPSTAKQVARRQAKSQKIKAKIPKRSQLKTAEVNIPLGIAHLKEMLDHYDGHPILATAAYNAGQHRVDMWLKDNTIADTTVWIEQIPFKETREYVKNVLTYEAIYSRLANSPKSYLSQLSKYPIPTKKVSQAELTAH